MSADKPVKPLGGPVDKAKMWETEYKHLLQVLASPPPGWFTFGHHIDQDVPLEFWGDDGGGIPIWERPVEPAPGPQGARVPVRITRPSLVQAWSKAIQRAMHDPVYNSEFGAALHLSEILGVDINHAELDEAFTSASRQDDPVAAIAEALGFEVVDDGDDDIQVVNGEVIIP